MRNNSSDAILARYKKALLQATVSHCPEIYDCLRDIPYLVMQRDKMREALRYFADNPDTFNAQIMEVKIEEALRG